MLKLRRFLKLCVLYVLMAVCLQACNDQTEISDESNFPRTLYIFPKIDNAETLVSYNLNEISRCNLDVFSQPLVSELAIQSPSDTSWIHLDISNPEILKAESNWANIRIDHLTSDLLISAKANDTGYARHLGIMLEAYDSKLKHHITFVIGLDQSSKD